MQAKNFETPPPLSIWQQFKIVCCIGAIWNILTIVLCFLRMDSVSGSLKDSEPTSPVSPGSPDPSAVKSKSTTPGSLLQALSTLNAKEECTNGLYNCA